MLSLCAQDVFAADGYVPRLDEARIGATTPANAELQALFAPLPAIARPYNPALAWIFTPRPLIGASISLQGKTSEVYGGLAWTMPITGRFFTEFTAGGLVHDQNLNQSYDDRPSPLSTRFLFRESIALGYEINPQWQVLAFAAHGSNGKLGYRNESVNRYGVLLARKFGPPTDRFEKPDGTLATFVWSGPYFGFSVGVARGNYDLLSPTPTDVTSNTNSVHLAAQAGYNVMLGRVLVGGEVDYSVQGINGSANVTTTDQAFSASSSWLVTARGRVGAEFAIPYVSERLLIYGTGGLAISRIANGFCPNASVQCYNKATVDIAGGWSSQGAVRSGWTAGGGLELPLARMVTAKFEYLYVDFGSFGFNNGVVVNEISFNEHILRAGMNFKLN